MSFEKVNPKDKANQPSPEGPEATQLKGKSMAPPSFGISAGPIQQKSEEEGGEQESMQLKEASSGGMEMSGAPDDSSSGSGGLPPAIQAKMEGSFGQDFSGVNIHQNSSQATQAGALAYTQGSDVHFAPGQFKPETQGGQELIGHELTHVVQQQQGTVKPTTQMKGMAINDDKSLEKEADVMGAKAAAGEFAGSVSATSSASGVQMKADPIQRVAREEEDLDRVKLESKKDNSFVASRWERSDGTKTAYATKFDEKLKEELKKEFGEEKTYEQVLKMIEDAKAANDTTLAEDYRKKLFRANQYAIVEALNVDSKTGTGTASGNNALGKAFTSDANHEMYGRTSGATYCNIYATDVVAAMGGYIPRVWWLEKYEKEAIEAMNKKVAYETKPKYGETVQEMNANALNAWFPRVGSYFNWEKAASMEDAQNAANEGNIVVLCAANKVASKSGHISVILAERDQLEAQKKDGKVDIPLTSQAGASNWKYKVGSKWWENSDHKDGAAWIHRGAIDSPLFTPEQSGVADGKATTEETKVGENSTTTTNTTTTANTTTNTSTGTNTTTNANTTTNSNSTTNTNTSTNNTTTTTDTPVKSEPTNTTTTANTTPTTDDKKLVVSKGAMIMATEGGFGNNRYDVRYPHFPENLAIYEPLGPGDLENDKLTKYDKVEANRVTVAKKGAYKMKKMLNAHTESDYDTKAGTNELLATGPNNSGLTIGFGFDIGARFKAGEAETAKSEMMKAGIPEKDAKTLSGAVGLRGVQAGRMAAKLRGAIRITETMAINLINVIYSSYELNFTKGVVHPAIEDVMTKINYWQGGTGGKTEVTAIFNAAKVKQGTEQFDAAIEVLKGFTSSKDSYKIMYQFLEQIKAKIEEGYEVEFVDKVSSKEELIDGTNDTFDLIHEAVKDTKQEGKDLKGELTGKPTKSSTTGTKGSTTGTSTTVKTPVQGKLITASVGKGGTNNVKDIAVIKTHLRNAGFAPGSLPIADEALTQAIIGFQKKYFKWTPDGLVEPGGKTEGKLAEFKTAPTTKPEPKTQTVVPPAKQIDDNYQKYLKGEIGMPQLARALKPFAASNGSLVAAVIDKLPWDAQDNFCFALANNSSESELKGFNSALLARMSEELSTYWTWSGDANAGQKKRVDAARGLQMIEQIKKQAGGGGSGATKPSTGDQSGKVVTDDEFSNGAVMLQDNKYKKGYAYIPFTGKITGTKYQPGDKLDPKDAAATYGSESGPTWCNQFAMDFAKKVTKDNPFGDLVQLNTGAGAMGTYMAETSEKFQALTSFEDAWKEANAGKLVFFSTPDHVSIAHPTAEKDMQTRTVEGKDYKFGKVIQAGASVGVMYINYAWGQAKFPKIKIYKYKGQ